VKWSFVGEIIVGRVKAMFKTRIPFHFSIDMFPHIQFLLFPLIISSISSFLLGFLWYGPFFGKTWVKLSKIDFDKECNSECVSEEIQRGMKLSLLNSILSSLILSVLVQIWRPSVWNAGPDYDSKLYYGTVTAFMIWIGFYVPVGLNSVAWECKSWSLFVFNAGYHLTNLVVMSTILSMAN
jgi:hypothetical protein